MKTKIGLIVMCAIFSFGISQSIFAQKDKKKGKETVTFVVDGFNCKNCQAKIEKNISFEKGVSDLKCDLATKTVEVTYKTDKTNPEELKAGFKKIGMEASVADSTKVNQ